MSRHIPVRSALAVAAMLCAAPAPAQERLPDPTERTSAAVARSGASAAPRWTLESTLISAERRIAVIDGVTVMVGDTVRGAHVLAIETNGVRLRTPDGIVVVSLSGGDPKRLAGGGGGR